MLLPERDAPALVRLSHAEPVRDPETVSSTTSSFPTPRRAAVAGDMAATLSQVTVVTGLGSSCSQPLFAKRPSWMVGSGRKVISRVSARIFETGAGIGADVTAFSGNAVPAMTPSWSARRHAVSKSPAIFGRHVSRTRS